MRATIHVTDSGTFTGLRRVIGRAYPVSIDGLIEGRVLTAAPLRDSRRRLPQFGRVATIGFWADDAAIDRFEADGPTTTGAWSARLEPLRAVPVAGGHFPGVPDDLPRGAVDYAGPVAVLTIAKLRRRRVVPFMRASGPAESQAHGAAGHLWSSGLANVAEGIVATFSFWQSGDTAHAYALSAGGHREALGVEARQSFHHEGSFVRFLPYAVRGELGGRNPLTPAVSALLSDTAATT